MERIRKVNDADIQISNLAELNFSFPSEAERDRPSAWRYFLMLSLEPYMWKGEGPTLSQNRSAIAFEVLGLPTNRKTLIAELNYAWKILRVVDGISGEWSGRYSSPEHALASLD